MIFVTTIYHLVFMHFHFKLILRPNKQETKINSKFKPAVVKIILGFLVTLEQSKNYCFVSFPSAPLVEIVFLSVTSQRNTFDPKTTLFQFPFGM